MINKLYTLHFPSKPDASPSPMTMVRSFEKEMPKLFSRDYLTTH